MAAACFSLVVRTLPVFFASTARKSARRAHRRRWIGEERIVEGSGDGWVRRCERGMCEEEERSPKLERVTRVGAGGVGRGWTSRLVLASAREERR